MQCKYCGAEINNNSNVCEFCGSRIPLEMKREQEQLNKTGCPKCKSTNITFNREKQGEVKEKKGTTVVRSTVGMCKDCGYTWNTQGELTKKSKTWLWVLGWICIFPLPLTILLLRKKEMKPSIKYGIIAVAWIIYLMIGISGASGDTTNTKSDATISDEATNKTTTPGNSVDSTEYNQLSSESNEHHLYNNALVKDVMNGSRDKKLGEYAVIKANSSECTEEAIADIYFNYFKKNNFNWITLLYTDKNDGSGIYFNNAMIGVNDIFVQDKYGDYSVITPDDEIVYIPNDDGKTITKMEFDED